eukprot:623335-Pelagomonas_calceolata.AAC.1
MPVAVCLNVQDNGVVRTYGNANQAVSAVESGVVLVDRSHWGWVFPCMNPFVCVIWKQKGIGSAIQTLHWPSKRIPTGLGSLSNGLVT